MKNIIPKLDINFNDEQIMDRQKERYQLVIGFVAIVISLSAFKDQLDKVKLNLGFASLTLSDYLLSLTLGFVLVVYIYTIPFLFITTKILSNLIVFYI